MSNDSILLFTSAPLGNKTVTETGIYNTRVSLMLLMSRFFPLLSFDRHHVPRSSFRHRARLTLVVFSGFNCADSNSYRFSICLFSLSRLRWLVPSVDFDMHTVTALAASDCPRKSRDIEQGRPYWKDNCFSTSRHWYASQGCYCRRWHCRNYSSCRPNAQWP